MDRSSAISLPQQPAQAIGFSGHLRAKDETGNVSGSHKARQLRGG